MFNKLVDVLKEVFWLKPSKKKTAKRKPVARKAVKKKTAKSSPKPKTQPVLKSVKPAIKSKVVKVKPAPLPKTPKVPKKKEVLIDPNLAQVGEITHYFERIKVVVVKITGGSILIGDKLMIIGKKTKFPQKVWSMQIESLDVKVAKKRQLVGLKVDKPVEVGDKVYK
jgi:hypothetical protein